MKRDSRKAAFAAVCMLTMASMACTFSLFQTPTIPGVPTQLPKPAIPTATMLPKAQTLFMASIPEPLQAGESLGLAVLDEVTGLAFNPQVYPMQSEDGTNFTATLALPYGATVR